MIFTACSGGQGGAPNAIITVDENEFAISDMIITGWTLSPGLKGVGSTISFTTAWIKRTKVSGTPQVALDIGGVTRYADYVSGDGTNFLTFSYTVQAGDNDFDGIQIVSPLNMNGGSITDVFDRDATEAFTAPDASGYIVDTTGSVFQSMTVPADANYGIYIDLDFTVTFDEVVNVSGTPQIALDIFGSTVYADYIGGTGSTILSF